MKNEYNFNLNGIAVNITKENTNKKYFSKMVNYFYRLLNEDTIYYYIDREDYDNSENNKEETLVLEDTAETVNGMRIDKLFEVLKLSLDKKGYKREEKLQYVSKLFPDKEIIYATEITLIEMQNVVRQKRIARKSERGIENKKTLLSQLLEDISMAISENTDILKVNQLIDTLKEGNEYEVVSGIFYGIKNDLLFVRKNGGKVNNLSPLALLSVIKSKVFTSK